MCEWVGGVVDGKTKCLKIKRHNAEWYGSRGSTLEFAITLIIHEIIWLCWFGLIAVFAPQQHLYMYNNNTHNIDVLAHCVRVCVFVSAFLFHNHQIVRSHFIYNGMFCYMSHAFRFPLPHSRILFVCASKCVHVCVRINLFRNFAFTRISLFTVIGYYLFTRVRSPVLYIFIWYSSSLCFSERENEREWERERVQECETETASESGCVCGSAK